jgi:hypothetical protein
MDCRKQISRITSADCLERSERHLGNPGPVGPAGGFLNNNSPKYILNLISFKDEIFKKKFKKSRNLKKHRSYKSIH